MPAPNSRQIGRAGELFIQFLLLRSGVESAQMTTDDGIDLVAFMPGRRTTLTIQVKTNLAPKPGGGRGKAALDWWVPDNCPADLIACVDLSVPRAWLFRRAAFRRLAQQHSSGRRHLYMWCDPSVSTKRKRRVLDSQFADYSAQRQIERTFATRGG